MTTLGANGRFGNQLLQYAFLKLYAEPRGIEVEVPDWIGRDIFALIDPFPGTPLPRLHEEDFDAAAALATAGIGPSNVDLWGYFALSGSNYLPQRDALRALFGLSAPARASVDAAAAKARARGRTLVALHIRRGDFGQGIHWAAPTDWYVRWLDGLWSTLEAPTLYVATDDPSVISDFARFEPLAAADLWTPVPGVEFLLDFVMLTQADVLATSNSTFSGVAALLNENAALFMRPHPDLSQLVGYDPWSAPMLLSGAGRT